jgi:hypothetical protein
MSFPSKNSDGARQLGLFGRPSLNILPRLKAAMREALRTSGLSRDQVADLMTEICRTEGIRLPGNSKAISRALLDKWVADGANHVIPITLLPVFCTATASSLPLGVLARALELEVIGPESQRLLQWARAEVERRRAAKEARKLAEEIGI